MSVEFDQRFLVLLETEERQRLNSGVPREHAEDSGSLSAQRLGDGLGGRFAPWALDGASPKRARVSTVET